MSVGSFVEMFHGYILVQTHFLWGLRGIWGSSFTVKKAVSQLYILINHCSDKSALTVSSPIVCGPWQTDDVNIDITIYGAPHLILTYL